MTTESLVTQLHRAHLEDLSTVTDIAPNVGERFVCPICLVDFGPEDFEAGNLTDGHVWPAYLREKSGSHAARTQRVLLCRRCNSDAGGHGDGQVQLMEQVRDAEGKGELYGVRTIEVLHGLGKEPIVIRARIFQPAPLSATLKFDIDKRTGNWARNDPKAQALFEALGDQGQPVSMVVHPHPHLKPHLARAGWVTSAYLLAFYALGYRYIFHESLNVVRQYIIESFAVEAKQGLDLPSSEVFRFEMTDEGYKDPQISLIIPIRGDKPVRLQANFLQYQVTLPFRFDDSALRTLIFARTTNVEALISRALETGHPLAASIQCTKTEPHDCLWDYVLGKPISSDD